MHIFGAGFSCLRAAALIAEEGVSDEVRDLMQGAPRYHYQTSKSVHHCYVVTTTAVMIRRGKHDQERTT